MFWLADALGGVNGEPGWGRFAARPGSACSEHPAQPCEWTVRMELLLLAARVVLAAVFGTAACTKLVDPTGTQQAIIAFGVPARLARPLRVFLPLAELAIALALIPI